jgi:Pyruvate/2-oxoacid:ferredoxin oxidoreductase delta subunit
MRTSINLHLAVLALGQDSDSDFLRKVPGVEFKWDTVVVDQQMMTGNPGLFAGGDMVPAERTVTVAVGHGKKAARCIDAWLRGATYDKPASSSLVTFDMLHLPVFSDVDPAVQRQLSTRERAAGFEEVVGGLSEPEARHEAQRCLSCGNCFECDNCYGVCPDNAVTKLGPGRRFEFKYDYCKGCGICVAECPCGAIKMVPEAI